MQVIFEVSVVHYDLLEIRWPKPFGAAGSAPYHALADVLVAVDGVDRVEVLRYTAQLLVAEHVESLGAVVQYVQTALLENAALANVLRTQCGVENYSVVVLPDVVTRPRTE